MFVSAFEYKKAANQELLDVAEPQLNLLDSDDERYFLRILNHTSVVDSLFISRLSGTTEIYQADNTVNTPSISELRALMLTCDNWLIDYTKQLSAIELHRMISFQFVDGDQGQLTVQEILLHLLMHGSNHRGMAAKVLAANNLIRPKDTYTRYLHQTEPLRRSSREE